MRTVVTKVRRGPKGNLVGVCGMAAMIEDIFAWLCDGAERPAGMATDDACGVIEISPDGACWKHEQHGRFRVEAPFFAVGSGADFALMAMELGKGAAEAVSLSARFDTGTGDGVDSLAFIPAKRTQARKPSKGRAKR